MTERMRWFVVIIGGIVSGFFGLATVIYPPAIIGLGIVAIVVWKIWRNRKQRELI